MIIPLCTVIVYKNKLENNLHKQQTPNPDAHVPEAVPPNFEQSDEL